jgi:hypothetical protein
VKTPRPGIWDMLGRAKWYAMCMALFVTTRDRRIDRDAWAKHKDLDPHEAKRLYVEALLKVRTTSATLSDLIYTLFQGAATIFRQKVSGRRARIISRK